MQVEILKQFVGLEKSCNDSIIPVVCLPFLHVCGFVEKFKQFNMGCKFVHCGIGFGHNDMDI